MTITEIEQELKTIYSDLLQGGEEGEEVYALLRDATKALMKLRANINSLRSIEDEIVEDEKARAQAL